MANSIDPSQLANEITKELEKWNNGKEKEVENLTKEYGKKLDNAVKDSIRANGNVRTGQYVESIKQRTEAATGQRSITVYSKDHYQLTHLLEKGHRKKNGGRVNAYPHWLENEQEINDTFRKELERLYEN